MLKRIVNTLDDINNVDETGATADDFLQYDGPDWVVFDLFASANTFFRTQTIVGLTDENQLVLTAVASQTANALIVEQSDGTDVFQVAENGTTTIGDAAGGDAPIKFYDAGVLFYTAGLESATDDWILTEGAFGSSQNLIRFDAAANALLFNDSGRDIDFQISSSSTTNFILADAGAGVLFVRGPIQSISEGGLGGFVHIKNYNATAGAGCFLLCQRSRGTESSTSPVLSGDTLGGVITQAVDAVSGSFMAGGLLQSVATENWGASAHGNEWQLHTVPNGSTTQTLALTIGQDQSGTFESSLVVKEDVTLNESQADLTGVNSATAVTHSPTFTASGTVNTFKVLNDESQITVGTSSIFTYSGWNHQPTLTSTVAPAGAHAATMFGSAPTLTTSTAAVPPASCVSFVSDPNIVAENVAAGTGNSVHGYKANAEITANGASGTITVPAVYGLQSSTRLTAGTAGGSATLTNLYDLSVGGVTTSGASGTKVLTNHYGLHIVDDTLATNYHGVWSDITSGANKYFINHTGTAKSAFGGDVEFEGDILPGTNQTHNIGADNNTFARIFLDNPTAGQTARAGHRGFQYYATNGDFFAGNDNVFPGYYSQRVTVTNSTATNYTEDYTNLLQGDSTYPFMELNYNAGDGTTGGLGWFSTERDGAVAIGTYDSINSLGGGGLFISARARAGLYIVGDESNSRMLFEGVGFSKSGATYTGLAVAGDYTELTPEVDGAVDLGTSSYQWGEIHTTKGQVVGQKTLATTTDTLDSTDYVVLVDDDTAAGAVTITLPAAASHTGRVYHIKKLGTTANVTVDGNASETIDGATTAILSKQYDSIKIVCDGTNWSII
jgi:hypothetical protein